MVVVGNMIPFGPAMTVSEPIVSVVVGAPGPMDRVCPLMIAIVEPMSKGTPSTVAAVYEAAGVIAALDSGTVDEPAMMAEGPRV